MIVDGPNLAETPDQVNQPVIGWDNAVLSSSMTADSEDPDFPIANVANPATHLFWRSGSTADQDFTFTNAGAELVDYVGIAGHNFGTGSITVRVVSGATVLTDWITPAGNTPLIFRFPSSAYATITVELQPIYEEPQAAVMYAGSILRLPRRIYVGHSILSYNRRANVVSGYSDEGQFLGRIVLGETSESQISMQNILPAEFRSSIAPWLADAIERPFFFAWRPVTYPRETGFCWATNDAQVSNQRANGMMQFSLSMRGIIG